MNCIRRDDHDALISAAYLARGFDLDEAQAAAKMASEATWHGNQTHNALKALHLDDLFGSKVGGCLPGASIERIPHRFPASEAWNCHRKLGQAVAIEAFNRAIELAELYGTGTISVDNAFHYLWGGGYVIEAAKRGYIAYTNCTSTITEVVPFGGKRPSLGTNPHSWGLPTTEAIGFPICIDWATSNIAMGRVQQLAREGKSLPPHSAIDAQGQPTTDPTKVAALLPFGAHKGYGLSLLDELFGAFIGCSLPSHRGRALPSPEEKNSSAFFFQIIHPESLSGQAFAGHRSQIDNVKRVIDDILRDNEDALLPGQLEAQAAARSAAAGGLLFTDAELAELQALAQQLKRPALVTL